MRSWSMLSLRLSCWSAGILCFVSVPKRSSVSTFQLWVYKRLLTCKYAQLIWPTTMCRAVEVAHRNKSTFPHQPMIPWEDRCGGLPGAGLLGRLLPSVMSLCLRAGLTGAASNLLRLCMYCMGWCRLLCLSFYGHFKVLYNDDLPEEMEVSLRLDFLMGKLPFVPQMPFSL